MKKIRIGAGAGCCKDRIEPVEELLAKGRLDYLVFETLEAPQIMGTGQKRALAGNIEI